MQARQHIQPEMIEPVIPHKKRPPQDELHHFAAGEDHHNRLSAVPVRKPPEEEARKDPEDRTHQHQDLDTELGKAHFRLKIDEHKTAHQPVAEHLDREKSGQTPEVPGTDHFLQLGQQFGAVLFRCRLRVRDERLKQHGKIRGNRTAEDQDEIGPALVTPQDVRAVTECDPEKIDADNAESGMKRPVMIAFSRRRDVAFPRHHHGGRHLDRHIEQPVKDHERNHTRHRRQILPEQRQKTDRPEKRISQRPDGKPEQFPVAITGLKHCTRQLHQQTELTKRRGVPDLLVREFQRKQQTGKQRSGGN